MIDVNDVLDRLKNRLDIKHDSNLGRVFKVSRNTIYSWRSRNTIDFPKLFEITQEHDFNTDIILFGSPSSSHSKSGQGSRPSQKQPLENAPGQAFDIIGSVIKQTGKDAIINIDIEHKTITITYNEVV